MKPIQTSLIHTVVPPRRQKEGKHPALILLHGRGTDENDLLGLAPYLDERLLIISARAPHRFQYGGYAWYDALEIGSPDPRMFAESYEKLTQFLRDVQSGYPIDPSRIFLLGFSMGTVMSYALALTHPEAIAGVVAHSGYIPEKTNLKFHWNNLSGHSFFIAHGVYDSVIPIHWGERANELLSKTQAGVAYHKYPIAHQVSEESLNDLSSWLTNHLDSRLNVAK